MNMEQLLHAWSTYTSKLAVFFKKNCSIAKKCCLVWTELYYSCTSRKLIPYCSLICLVLRDKKNPFVYIWRSMLRMYLFLLEKEGKWENIFSFQESDRTGI
jgi:hypothetical protein